MKFWTRYLHSRGTPLTSLSPTLTFFPFLSFLRQWRAHKRRKRLQHLLQVYLAFSHKRCIKNLETRGLYGRIKILMKLYVIHKSNIDATCTLCKVRAQNILRTHDKNTSNVNSRIKYSDIVCYNRSNIAFTENLQMYKWNCVNSIGEKQSIHVWRACNIFTVLIK